MKELDKDRSSLQGDAQVTFLKSPLQVDDVAVKLLSHVQLFATLWTAAHQAPLSMGFPKQEYSGCHFPFQRIFLIQGSNPTFLALAGEFFTTKPPGKPKSWESDCKNKNEL